jgi:hypothetical protein
LFGPSLARLSDPDPADSGLEAETIAAQYGKAWSQLLTAVCAVFFLIGTEEVARATVPHAPSAASSGDMRMAHARNRARALAMAHAASYSHRKAKCGGCGAVVSMREIRPTDVTDRPDAESAMQSAAYYEFVIRMPDGSNRVVTGANPEAWREGERVTVIDRVTLVASR